METIKMTWDEFEAKFKPKMNHLADGEAPFNGWMYETYGVELEYIQGQSIYQVWTIGDCGHVYIGNGNHPVNRTGYVVTENPWKEGDDYYIVDFDDICRYIAENAVAAMEEATGEEDLDEVDYVYKFETKSVSREGTCGLRDLLAYVLEQAYLLKVIDEDFDYSDYVDQRSINQTLMDIAAQKKVDFNLEMCRA